MTTKPHTYSYTVTNEYATSATIAYLIASSRGNKLRVLSNYVLIGSFISCLFVYAILFFIDQEVLVGVLSDVLLPILGIAVGLSLLMFAYTRKILLIASGGMGATVEIKLDSTAIRAKTTGVEQKLEYNALSGIYIRGDIAAVYYGAKRTAIIIMKIDNAAKEILENKLAKVTR